MNFKELFDLNLKNILLMLLFCTCAVIISYILQYFHVNQSAVHTVFLLAVFLTARFTSGYFCGVIASVLSIILINYFFTFPYFELNVSLPGYPITIVSIFTVSVVTSMATTRLIEHENLKKEAEHEAMRSNLLRSVSHDLRTPLTSIIGAADALKSNFDSLDDKEKLELYDDIENEAQWLYNMVENLLSVTRLNNSQENIHKTPELVEEIIPDAVRKLKKYYKNINIDVKIPSEMLFIPMDSTLIKQVIINLCENSIRHGKTTDSIWINVEENGKYAKFSILDNGTGIEKSIITSINSGKYISPTPDSDTSKYMGIGLSVCEAIINAHGGYIYAENISTGASVSFFLPVD